MLKSVERLNEEIRILDHTTDTDTTNLEQIADDISNEIKREYIKLPTDINDETIHVGDAMTDGEYRFEVFELSFTPSGWTVSSDVGSAWACVDVSHYHKPTVDDVLIKLLETAVGYSDAHTTVAYSAVEEAAKMLRLKEDE